MELLNLFAKLVLDSSEYKQGIEEAQSEAEELSDSIDSAGGSFDDLADSMTDAGDAASDSAGDQGKLADEINKSSESSASGSSALEKYKDVLNKVKGAAAAMVAVKVAKWLWDTTEAVAAYGDHIDKASQKMGLSAQSYQEWAFIAEHSGTSIDGLTTSMRTLTNQAATNKEAFESLGMSFEDVQKMSQEELFENTIRALQNVEDTTERTRLATKLLGRGAMELGPLFNSTGGDIDKMKDRIAELGGVMSDRAVKNSAAYKDAVTDLQTAVQGAKNNIAEFFMEFNTDVINAAANALGYLNRAFDDLFPDSYEEELERNQRKLEALRKSYESFANAGDEVSAASVWNMIEITEAKIDELNGKISSTADATDSSVAAQEAKLAELQTAYSETYESVSESLSGWFGVFDDASYEVTTSVEEMMANLQSQADFWDKYEKNLSTLSEKGFGDLVEAVESMGPAGAQYAEALAQMADSGEEGEAQLQALSDKMAEVEEKRNEAADTVTAIEFVDNSDETLRHIDDIKKKLGLLNGTRATVYVDVDADKLPSGGGAGRAGGLDYVPYHNYPALLHEGEAVLTKSEAQAWRNGEAIGVTFDPAVSAILEVLQEIAANGLNANVDTRSLYRSMRMENKTRTTATNYNALAMA